MFGHRIVTPENKHHPDNDNAMCTNKRKTERTEFVDIKIVTSSNNIVTLEMSADRLFPVSSTYQVTLVEPGCRRGADRES